jgi:hypothetical protein
MDLESPVNILPQCQGSSALEAGARIANGRGVPGVLGAVAILRHDGAPVLLSSHHVLFGGGAVAGEPVWSMPSLQRLGSTLYGTLGGVTRGGRACHVDCAVASIDGDVPDWQLERPPPRVQPGAIVSLDGGACGGVAHVRDLDGAPGQILVRPMVAGEPFSVEGDSGAVLRDQDGAAVGLVWGATPAGETIASPLGPVLDVLGIDLVRLQT